MRGRAQTIFVAVAVGILGSFLPNARSATARGEGAFDDTAYVAISVTKDGEAFDFWRRNRLRVNFEKRNRGDSVGWNAGCNFFGADLELEGERLVTGDIFSTAMGCVPAKRRRQDEFFSRFFERDPAYVTQGNGLTLSAGKVVIELQLRENE